MINEKFLLEKLINALQGAIERGEISLRSDIGIFSLAQILAKDINTI